VSNQENTRKERAQLESHIERITDFDSIVETIITIRGTSTWRNLAVVNIREFDKAPHFKFGQSIPCTLG
jgi:hypothetical protein